MTHYVTGQTVTDTFHTASAGESFTVEATFAPVGATLTPTFIDLGGGYYRLEFLATHAGDWFIRFTGDTSGSVKEGEWKVHESGGLVEVPVSPATAGPTLSALRREIAANVKDLLDLTATEVGSLTTFKDAIGLFEDFDHFRGAEVLFTSGANTGQRRRVATSDTETYTITFAPPNLPAIPQPSDTAELYNRRGVNFALQEYNRAINQALAHAHPHNKVPVTQVIPEVFEQDVIVFDLPEVFTHINGVEWEDSEGIWYPIRRAVRPHGQGWWVEPGVEKVGLGGLVRFFANQRALRINGYRRSPDLVLDSDITNTDREWLTNQATGLLLMSKRDDANMAWGQYWLNRADALRSKLVQPTEPDTIQVRG